MDDSTEPQISFGSKLYNPLPSIVTNIAASRFIDSISKELSAGYGFVPFIGAGLSAPSGAPLVSGFTPLSASVHLARSRMR